MVKTCTTRNCMRTWCKIILVWNHVSQLLYDYVLASKSDEKRKYGGGEGPHHVSWPKYDHASPKMYDSKYFAWLLKKYISQSSNQKRNSLFTGNNFYVRFSYGCFNFTEKHVKLAPLST